MKKPALHYSPRPGSKVAEAIEALSNGPMTPGELAKVLQRDSSAINTLLLRALTHQAIIKIKDHRGRLHFAIPDTALGHQFTVVNKTESAPAITSLPSKQNILRLQIASNTKSPTLISSNVTANVTAIDSIEKTERNTSERIVNQIPAPLRGNAMSTPVIAGLFSDGELTISLGNECLQLDVSQRQQLYAYLHKIRYLE